MKPPIHFHVLDYPGSQKSAIWGMLDMLAFANAQARQHGRELFVYEIIPSPDRDADVVVLPPALTLEPPNLPAGWRDALVSQAKSGTVLASICSGAFLLAETGILAGRRTTTHWRHAELLRQRYPDVIIDSDHLVVDLGDVVTAGGVMAWTDLTLHMIQRFGGRKLMLDVARMFVLDPPERKQSYYATFVPNRNHSDSAIAMVQDTIHADLGKTHSLADLAAAGSLSERSLQRRFKEATGKTPVRYLQLLRVEAARSRLELTRDSFERISWDLGYSDTASFRTIFRKCVGLTPSDYRDRFGLGQLVTGDAGREL